LPYRFLAEDLNRTLGGARRHLACDCVIESSVCGAAIDRFDPIENAPEE